VIINLILVYKFIKEQSHGSNAVPRLPQYTIVIKQNNGFGKNETMVRVNQ